MLRVVIGALAIAVLAAAAPASAAKVFLNDKEITPYLSNLKNKSFDGVKVRIDANGDVRIEAPQYAVEFQEPARPASTPSAQGVAPPPGVAEPGGPNASLRERYFLVTQPSRAGAAQYDFEVFVNGVKKRSVPAGSGQIIVEISAWLRAGDNEVKVVARKSIGEKRKSYSAQDTATLLIGTGHDENKIVKIDSVLHKLTVSAAQSTNITKYYQIRAK